MIQLHAQPYDLAANGFYFECADEYRSKAKDNRNDYGDPVEEYEIQFIDGYDIDCALAKAWGINQANFAAYLDAADDWDEHTKQAYIITVGECSGDHDDFVGDPDSADVDIYPLSSLRELAEQFVNEGLLGDIPERIAHYLDYDAIARDLGMDYSETTIAGEHLIFRCA